MNIRETGDRKQSQVRSGSQALDSLLDLPSPFQPASLFCWSFVHFLFSWDGLGCQEFQGALDINVSMHWERGFSCLQLSFKGKHTPPFAGFCPGMHDGSKHAVCVSLCV